MYHQGPNSGQFEFDGKMFHKSAVFTAVNIWELRRAAAGLLGEECCPILVW